MITGKDASVVLQDGPQGSSWEKGVGGGGRGRREEGGELNVRKGGTGVYLQEG